MDNLINDLLSNGNMLFYVVIILVLIIITCILILVSMNTKFGLKQYWGVLDLFRYKQFYFFIAKTSAYRRILYFFTIISYGLRILSVLTTFFIIYSLVDESEFSNALLVLAALCDGVNLLFPFQKYVDLFSKCCVKMEDGILKNNSKIVDKNENDRLSLLTEIYEDLSKVYIECEDLIHNQNRI